MAKGEDKTEQPTARRLREARREGRLPQSVEVPQALTLTAAVLIVPGLLPRLERVLVDGWRQAMASVAVDDPKPALGQLGHLAEAGMLALLPLLGAIAVCAVVARALLGGVHVNTHHLRPKPRQFNPFTGLRGLFSLRQFATLARLVVKIAALAAVTYLLWSTFLAAVLLGPASLGATLSGLGSAVHAYLVAVLGLSLVTGALDGGLAVRRYRKDLRMTRQEVRDDARQTESNPLVKQEIRARQRKLSRLRMVAEVARADVVITNPTHLAVALRYDAGSVAPTVVAKGAELMAARIRQVAADHHVPIKENKPLARALYTSVEIGEVIPVEFYQAVAEVLAAVYRSSRRSDDTAGPSGAAT